MARRCPECYAELPEDAVWVCPTCKYTLRTPATAKAGIVFMVLGLALPAAYVYGPDQIGLRLGLVPTDLANLTIANFSLLVLGAMRSGRKWWTTMRATTSFGSTARMRSASSSCLSIFSAMEPSPYAEARGPSATSDVSSVYANPSYCKTLPIRLLTVSICGSISLG